jgi:hypothetical protein
VSVIVAINGVEFGFEAKKELTFPVPDAGSPIDGTLLTQAYDVPVPFTLINWVVSPLQTT